MPSIEYSGKTYEYKNIQFLPDEVSDAIFQKKIEEKKERKMQELQVKKNAYKRKVTREKALMKVKLLEQEVRNIKSEGDFVFANVALINPRAEQRFRKTLEWVAEGKTKGEITDLCMSEYKLDISDATKLYFSSMKYMKALADENKEMLRDMQLTMLQSLYADAIKDKDRREAREILKDIAKLQGLINTGTQQNNISINGDNVAFQFNMPTSKKPEIEEGSIPLSTENLSLDYPFTDFEDLLDEDEEENDEFQ